MVAVTCPICGTGVVSDDVDGLGESMKEHLVVVHDMRNLSKFTVPGVGIASTAGELETGPAEGFRAVKVSPSAFQKGWESIEEKGTYSTGARSGETITGVALNCPFCGQRVVGRDADGLGRGLKDHWASDHHIRPTIRAELGMQRAEYAP